MTTKPAASARVALFQSVSEELDVEVEVDVAEEVADAVAELDPDALGAPPLGAPPPPPEPIPVAEAVEEDR
jgi:hypothetical protein